LAGHKSSSTSRMIRFFPGNSVTSAVGSPAQYDYIALFCFVTQCKKELPLGLPLS
jgi:hypothetical protein